MSSAHLRKFAQIKSADIEWREGLPYSLEFDDIYFSSENGLAESNYVFIDGNQLECDWLQQEQSHFTLVELGFGSGLNFLATANKWQKLRLNNSSVKNKTLHYTSIEKRPLRHEDLDKACRCWPELSDIAKQLIKDYPSLTYGRHQLYFRSLNITLTLVFMSADEALADMLAESEGQQNKIQVDHWFLDGFAPVKNESMWNDSLIDIITRLSKIGTRLATFSVAASVKKPLIQAGFDIKKRKGFGRKREMLTAQLKSKIVETQKSKYINLKYDQPWFNYSKNPRAKRVAIVGAGIAGCATAYTLANYGFEVDLYESSSDIATKASGAAAGIFHPQLTSDMNVASQFSWNAYLYLLRFLSSLEEEDKSRVLANCGLVRILETQKIRDKLISLSDSLSISDWIEESKNSTPGKPSVFYPQSGAINIPEFCSLLLRLIPCERLNLHLNHQVTALSYEQGNTTLSFGTMEKKYSQVIFCGGARSNLTKYFVDTSTQVTRGQTCIIECPELTKKLSQTICEKVYMVPQSNGNLQVGTSFEDLVDDELNTKSQLDILRRVTAFTKKLELPFLSQEQIDRLPVRGTVGYRLHSKDRLPLIGALVDRKKLQRDFQNIGQRRIERAHLSHYNIPGLWMNTAYGSHGLLYSLLGSAFVASLVGENLSPVNRGIACALNPARFLIKQLQNT